MRGGSKMILGLTDEEIRNCGYATHLPILDFLLDEIKPQASLEWGMGLYSTPLLIEKSPKVCSIETTSLEWSEKMSEKFLHCDCCFSVETKISDTGALDILDNLSNSSDCWDLILNDGDAHSRHIIAQTCQFWDPVGTVIVSHDTQEKQYRYDSILIREGWQWVDIMDYSVWTSVLTNKSELIQKLYNKFKKTKVYTGTGLFHKDFTHDHGRAL